jgi:hypothetical protein
MGTFLKVMGDALGILEELDGAVARGPGRAFDWHIAHLATGSAITNLEPRLRARKRAVSASAAEDIAAAFVSGLATLEEDAIQPPLYSIDTLSKVRKLTANFSASGATGLRTRILGGGTSPQASVTRTAGDHAGELLTPASQAIGSVTGVLGAISIVGRSQYDVYEDHTNRRVRCEFDDADVEAVKAALGHRVIAAGVVQRNRRGNPLRVLQPGFKVLPPEDQLPGLSDLIGSDPDFTDGQPAVEWVRQGRG